MRVKIIKSNKKYKKGQTITVSPNEGFGLIDSGYALQTKDITTSEFQTNKKVSINGGFSSLGINDSSRRKRKSGYTKQQHQQR